VTTILKLIAPDFSEKAATLTASYALTHCLDAAEARFQRDDPTWVRKAARHHREVWGEKADRGSYVHKLIEERLLEERLLNEADLLLGRIPTVLRPYLDSWEEFMKDYDARPVMVEQVVAHPLGDYFGTLDAVLEIPDVGNVIVDWKTGFVSDTTVLQLGGLLRLQRRREAGQSGDARLVPTTRVVTDDDPPWNETLPEIAEGWLVQLNPTYKVYRYDLEALERASETFFHVFQAWEALQTPINLPAGEEEPDKE